MYAYECFKQHGFTLVGIIVIVVYVNFYLLIPTAIIGFIFYKFRMFYLLTSRSVKRLEGISKYKKNILITVVTANLLGIINYVIFLNLN